MKRLLSLLLAVMMIASVAVVAASAASVDTAETAADKATITVTGFNNESSDTKTYRVGETFTVYTALNMSRLYDNGMISSITARQDYDSSILELAEELKGVGDDAGVIKDTATIMPILNKGTAIANAGDLGAVQYNATTAAMTSPYQFVDDTTMLLVLRYKVIAAGEADITTFIRTLCLSDYWCSKVVSKGQVVAGMEDFTVTVSLSDPETPAGSTLSGSITSFRSDEDEISVELLQNDATVDLTIVTGNAASYSFSDVEDGDYQLRISKKNHATRTYDVTVSGDTVQDAKIHLMGDISGDGAVKNGDYSRILAYLKGTKGLSDYEFACADISGDGAVKNGDLSRVLAYLKGTRELWTD